MDRDTGAGQTDSSKLHFKEQKLECDKEYYTALASKGYMRMVFLVISILAGTLIGSYGYTRSVSSAIAAVDIKLTTAQGDIKVNNQKYTSVMQQLARIEGKLDKALGID